MKTNAIKKAGIFTSLLILALTATTACSKEEKDKDPEPDPLVITDTYYLKAKFDGKWKVHQTNTKSWCQTGEGLCYTNINGSVNDIIDVDIRQAGHNFTAANIPSLAGDTIYFKDSDHRAGVHWRENGQILSSFNTNDPQTDSYFYVKEVVSDGVQFGFECFILSGTFQCVLGDNATGQTVQLTEGIYAIRVSEENI